MKMKQFHLKYIPFQTKSYNRIPYVCYINNYYVLTMYIMFIKRIKITFFIIPYHLLDHSIQILGIHILFTLFLFITKFKKKLKQKCLCFWNWKSFLIVVEQKKDIFLNSSIFHDTHSVYFVCGVLCKILHGRCPLLFCGLHVVIYYYMIYLQVCISLCWVCFCLFVLYSYHVLLLFYRYV